VNLQLDHFSDQKNKKTRPVYVAFFVDDIFVVCYPRVFIYVVCGYIHSSLFLKFSFVLF
jgi:hypothetical protein